VTPPRRAKNLAIYLAVRGALALVRPLPARALRAAGRVVGYLAYAVLPGARRIAFANVARAFPAKDDAARRALVRQNYRALGENLGDAVAMLGGRDAGADRVLRIDAASAAVLAHALSEGRGVLLASAHLGPWERVAASLVRHGVPLTAIVRAPYDSRFAPMFARLRGGARVPVIERGEPGASARIVRTLRAGRVLGVPMDLASRVPSIDALFLGSPAPTPVGPARIALRMRAPVVVATAAPARGPHGEDDSTADLRIEISRILTDDVAQASFPADRAARILTQRINDELARRIERLPAQWVWMHPRWGPVCRGQVSTPHAHTPPVTFSGAGDKSAQSKIEPA
jgi:KDO2-lipid IV(A) lauroyltransferase